MSIVNITDRERELESALSEEQRINGMGAEREYVLQGQVSQLTRKLELCVQAMVAREKELDELQNKLAANTRTSEILIEGANASAMRAWTERDELKAQLGDLPESQAAMLQEIKALRDALALAKDLTTIVRMPNVEYIADAHNKAVKNIQAALRQALK